MRWIKQNGDKIERGENIPPDGDAYFVDEQGSAAIVGGTLYVDGKKSQNSSHSMKFKDGNLDLAIDRQGKAKKKGGGKGV